MAWEVGTVGTRVIKTDVAWIGDGYRFAFDGVEQAVAGIENNSNARRFGYRPQFRSQDFQAQALAEQAKLPPDPVGDRFQGGPFCSSEYDADRK